MQINHEYLADVYQQLVVLHRDIARLQYELDTAGQRIRQLESALAQEARDVVVDR